MTSLFDTLVLDYPYEDALCMFRTKFESRDFYERVKRRKTAHPYYNYIASGLSRETLQTSLDLAVLFKDIHVHPIDLPVYKTREVLLITRPPSGQGAFVSNANADDRMDPNFQALLNLLRPVARPFVAQRINYHLLDANIHESPIVASDKILRLYTYKFSRGAIPPDHRNSSVPQNALALNRLVDAKVGLSLEISDRDDLVRIRKDRDIGAYRAKLEEFLTKLAAGEPIGDVQDEVEEALNTIEKMESYRARSRIMTYAGPLTYLADVLLSGGLPIVSSIVTALGIGQEAWTQRLEQKYRWIIFKYKPLSTR